MVPELLTPPRKVEMPSISTPSEPPEILPELETPPPVLGPN
jgi:hypothetical protein